jgi:hypothetical protein
MRRFLAAALLAILTATATASAQEASPISPAQLTKMSKYLDTTGTKKSFPPPMAQSLGLSSDATLDLPVVMVQTDDHNIYFSRSELNPADYIIWARVPGDKDSSYLFATHADFKLTHGLYLHTDRFPQPIDVNSNEVQAVYKKTLAALAKDIDASPPPKE